MTNQDKTILNSLIINQLEKQTINKNEDQKESILKMKELLNIDNNNQSHLNQKYKNNLELEELRHQFNHQINQHIKHPFHLPNQPLNQFTQVLNLSRQTNYFLQQNSSLNNPISHSLIQSFKILKCSLSHQNLDGYTSDMVECCVLDPKGKQIFTGADDGCVKAHLAYNLQQVAVIKIDELINDLVINDSGDILLIQCDKNTSLFIVMFIDECFHQVKQIESVYKIFISEFYKNDIIFGTKDQINRVSFNQDKQDRQLKTRDGKIEQIYSDIIKDIKKMKNKVTMVFVNDKLGLLFIGFKFGTILIYDLDNNAVGNGQVSQLEFQEAAIDILSHEKQLVSKDSTNTVQIYDIPIARENMFMSEPNKLITLSLPDDVQTQWSISYKETIYTIGVNRQSTQMVLSLINEVNKSFQFEIYSLETFRTIITEKFEPGGTTKFDNKICQTQQNPIHDYVLAIATQNGTIVIYDTSLAHEGSINPIIKFKLMAAHVNLANEDNMTVTNIIWSNVGDRLLISCDVGTIFVIGNDSSQVFASSWNFQKTAIELAHSHELDEMLNTTNSTRSLELDMKQGVGSSHCFVDINMCPQDTQPLKNHSSSMLHQLDLTKRLAINMANNAVIFEKQKVTKFDTFNKQYHDQIVNQINKVKLIESKNSNQTKSEISDPQPKILKNRKDFFQEQKLINSARAIKQTTRTKASAQPYYFRKKPKKKKDIQVDFVENQVDEPEDEDQDHLSDKMDDASQHDNSDDEVNSNSVDIKFSKDKDDINDFIVPDEEEDNEDDRFNQLKKSQTNHNNRKTRSKRSLAKDNIIIKRTPADSDDDQMDEEETIRSKSPNDADQRRRDAIRKDMKQARGNNNNHVQAKNTSIESTSTSENFITNKNAILNGNGNVMKNYVKPVIIDSNIDSIEDQMKKEYYNNQSRNVFDFDFKRNTGPKRKRDADEDVLIDKNASIKSSDELGLGVIQNKHKPMPIKNQLNISDDEEENNMKKKPFKILKKDSDSESDSNQMKSQPLDDSNNTSEMRDEIKGMSIKNDKFEENIRKLKKSSTFHVNMAENNLEADLNEIQLHRILVDWRQYFDSDQQKYQTQNQKLYPDKNKSVLSKRQTQSCALCNDKNNTMQNMCTKEQQEEINSKKAQFRSEQQDNMNLNEVNFICEFCYKYITITRNIKGKFTDRNPFVELRSIDLLDTIERTKQVRCHRCMDYGAIITCQSCSHNFHPQCATKYNFNELLNPVDFTCSSCFDSESNPNNNKNSQSNKLDFLTSHNTDIDQITGVMYKEHRVNYLKHFFQPNDEVQQIFQAHEMFIVNQKIKEERPYEKYRELQSDTLCIIDNVTFVSDSPSNDLIYLHCKLDLSIKSSQKTFSITWHYHQNGEFLIHKRAQENGLKKCVKEGERKQLYGIEYTENCLVVCEDSIVDERFTSLWNRIVMIELAQREDRKDKNKFQFIRAGVQELSQPGNSQLFDEMIKKQLQIDLSAKFKSIKHLNMQKEHNLDFWSKIDNIRQCPSFDLIDYKIKHKVQRTVKSVYVDIQLLKECQQNSIDYTSEQISDAVDFIESVQNILHNFQ